MNLPDVIKIRPLTVPVHGDLNFKSLCPGSKSLTNRSLILAALARGKTQLRGALCSEDTELMVNCLKKLGFHVEARADPSNACNRLITVHGQGGKIPAGEADLFVGTAGTVARFVTALCARGKGCYRLHGTPRMHDRPMKELFDAIRSLGGSVKDRNGHLPAVVSGPLRSGRVLIFGEDSSQFASALWLVSRISKTERIEVECEFSPYVEMTKALLKDWENPAKVREIEFDASSAGYFLALHYLHRKDEKRRPPGMKGLLKNSCQVDRLMEDYWPLREEISRKKDLGDTVLTYVIMAAARKCPLRLVDAANLREQECDRISAMAAELNKCGVPARELPDGLILSPATNFKRATIHTYNDHRIAMCFAVLATVDAMGDGKPWITIENPSCVEKTFPNFFKTLEDVARRSHQKAGQPFSPVVLTLDGKPVF